MRVAVIDNTEVSHLGQVGVALREADAEIQVFRAWAGEPLPDGNYHDALVVLGGEQNARADETHPYLPDLARLMRRMGYLPYVGLPNVLAGKFVVPEFIQDDATPENLAQALLNLYADKASCARIGEVFREIHLQLKQNTAEKAANAILAHLT